MAIMDRINEIKTHIEDAYGIAEEKGAEMPEKKNIENLANCIETISGGEPKPYIPTFPKFTGHVDVEGLKEIGWSDEDIQMFQEEGVFWDEEDDEKWKLTEEEKTNPNFLETRFLHSQNTQVRLSSRPNLIGIPSTTSIFSIINSSIVFIPNLTISNGTEFVFYRNTRLREIKKISSEGWWVRDGRSYSGDYGLFSLCSSLIKAPDLNFKDTLNISSLFSGCYLLQTSPLISNDGKIKYIDKAFYNCYSLKEIPELSFPNAERGDSMFQNCYSLEKIESLYTPLLKTGESMFCNCYALKELPELGGSEVTSLEDMFKNCYSLTRIASLDFPTTTIMKNTFYNCYSLLEIPEFFSQNVTDFSYFAQNCSNLMKIPKINISNAQNMMYMFCNCFFIKKAIFEGEAIELTSLAYIFSGCKELEKVYFESTPILDNMNYAFRNTSKLIELKGINYQNVTSLSYAFDGASVIPVLDLSTMDYTKLKNFSYAFRNCGTSTKQSYGAYADGIPYIIVKDEANQNWVLTKSNGHPSSWSTNNVIIAGSEQDFREREG